MNTLTRMSDEDFERISKLRVIVNLRQKQRQQKNVLLGVVSIVFVFLFASLLYYLN